MARRRGTRVTVELSKRSTRVYPPIQQGVPRADQLSSAQRPRLQCPHRGRLLRKGPVERVVHVMD